MQEGLFRESKLGKTVRLVKVHPVRFGRITEKWSVVISCVWGSRWHGVESRHPTIAVPLLSKKTIGEQVLSDVFWGMGGREFTHGSSGPPVAVQ